LCLRDGKGGRLLRYNVPFLLLTSDDGRFTREWRFVPALFEGLGTRD